MINITDIPHLRAYQPIVSLPKRNGEGSRGVVVFLSSPSLEESQTMLTGKTIQNASIRNYYVERIYHEKIGPRTEHLMVTMNEVPDKIKTNPSLTANRVNGVENLPTGSNRFIDLSIYNQLFFKVLNETNMTYTSICKEYMNMLKRTVVQDQYRIFPDKVVLINLDDWQNFSTKTFGRGDSLNNPAAIIYYSLYKFPELVKELGDVNIILYSQTSGYKVRINPSLTDGDSARRFRNEASRISPVTNRLMAGDFDTQLREEDVRNGIAATFGERYNLVGDTKDKTTTEIEKAVKKTVDKKDKENPDSILDTKDEIEEEVENDKALAGEVAKIIQTNKVGKSSTSSKRDEQLRKRQASIQIGNKSLSEILESKSANEIPVNNIDGKINTTNKNLMDVRFTNFEKAYNEQLLQKDIMSMVTALNDARLPVHVRSVKIEDKSDELNYVDRYYIQLEDENRVRHQLTFDMPKFIDDKFMYLHGNRKEIVKQQLMLPIVKARESEVQIVSNYKKIFVRREGDKLSPKVEKFKKFIDKSPKGFTSKAGNNTSSNKGYIRTIEFDILASKYDQIDFGSGKIFFNLSKVEEMCNEKKIKFTQEVDGEIESIVIGFYKGDKLNGQPIYLNVKTQTIVENFDIVDFISSFATDEQHKEISSMSAGKRYMYTSATLMRKKVPIALLVAYHEGMSGLLRKSGVKYYFTDKRPKTTPSERVIQFEDGYLVYEESTMEQTLLLNGLSIVPTRAYKFEEFDSKDVYLDIFDSLYKQRNIASAFDNFYDFMIDPITKEVLEDLDLPTEYIDVLIYASNLLADNDYTEETDLSLYRIRSNEILNAYLYNAIATAYSTYIATANNPNPVKISIPRDVVVKEVLTAQTIEDYSILNPIVEVEKGRSVTAKGPSGANLSQSYTMAKRSYSPSMTGVMAMTSSPDANVGVVRALSTEPSITSARGYITDNQERLKDLKDTNIFSPGELLSPLGASRDKWCCPTVWKHAVQELF